MTRRDESKLSMYLAVQHVCNANPTVWGGLAAFVTAFGEFETVIDGIHDTREQQETTSVGETQDKQQLRETLVVQAIEVSKKVKAFADATNDHALYESVNYGEGALLRAADTVLRDQTQVIHDVADGILASLVDYNVDAAMLAALQTDIDNFNDAIPRPRSAIITRRTATLELPELFAEGDDILKRRMDNLVEDFRESDPDFYEDYKGARIIVDGGVRTQLKGTVTDATTGDVIAGAEVLVLELGAGRLTNERGNYRFGRMRPGRFTIRVSKLGYTTLETTIVVEPGRVTDADFALELVTE